MNQFDIIGQLRTFAQAKGWHFIYGNDEYANFEAGQIEFEDDEIIFIADLNLSPNFASGGGINSVVFTGGVMLGRKREETTESTLDETMIQKYDNRLKDLLSLLFIGLGDFACEYGYDITQANGRIDINRFDHNIDFVAATITFSTD